MSNEHAKPDESPTPIEADVAAETVTEAVADATSEIATAEPTSTDLVSGEPENEAGAEEGTDVASGENTIDVTHAKRALEAVLLAASEPMPLIELRKIFDGEFSVDTLRNLLEEVRAEWSERSVELVVVASGYRFRVKPEYQGFLNKLSNDKPPRYSRAVLETLAIISYRQPVTRADIEDIRGVAVSPHILKTLEDRGWIDEVGHKDAPGRPALFATTKHFLDDLNLRSLEELPPLHELQATLDMSQAGSALSAGANLALPGVAADTADTADTAEEDSGKNTNEKNEIDIDDATHVTESSVGPTPTTTLPHTDSMNDTHAQSEDASTEPSRG